VSRVVAEPRMPTATRVTFDAESRQRLVPRQLAWAGVQGATALFAVSVLAGFPDLGFAMALGLGLAVSAPRQLHKGALVAAMIIVVTLMAGIPGDGSSTISTWATPGLAAQWTTRGLAGAQVLAGGAAAGLGLAWMHGPRDSTRFLQVGLAAAAMTAIGAWAAATLVPGALHPVLGTVTQGALAGLIASQALVVAALRFRTVTRPPSPSRIKATLREAFHAPCLRAWELDQDLARRSPDPETRDGLGEVAAWIYRLQWTLQKLEGEIGDLSPVKLVERIANLTEEAADTEDAFTRDRKLATASHLQQLLGHRRALAEEGARTSALADYAAAYLEEARAGLALAHLQPGDHAPPGLDDVLGKLREHSAERDARRRTAREVASVAG
jgi:membrane associated rhomboid family serine protease